MDYIKLALMLVSGVAWTIVYIDCIRIGFRHKTYTIPFWALALNIAWEMWHGIIGLKELGPQLQVIINAVWGLFDLVILYTYFKFGLKYFPKNLKPKWFYGWSISVLLISFVIQYAFIREFGTIMGGGYAAFLQNLVMSVLFISLYFNRNGREGQSLTIAINKCIGTLAPTILFGIVGSNSMGGPNDLMLLIGCLVFLFDASYIFLLYRAKYIEKRNFKP